MEYIIYCDESDSRGSYYSNFYGGALIRSKDLLEVENCLQQKKLKLNLHGEVKWSKITSNYRDKYVDLMNTFFNFVKDNKIKIRIMFTQNMHVANFTKYQQEQEYFLLYYQFIKHIFGLQYSNFQEMPIGIRIYFDQFPVSTREKVEQFKSYIYGLSKNPAFRKAKIAIRQDQIAEVSSHEHVILQCLDIVLGAVQFRLNDKHLAKPLGSMVRAKRTLAKEYVYKEINKSIRLIHPNFNIGITTGTGGNMENCWNHSYRHWLFKAHNSSTDLSKTKRAKKENPTSAMSLDVSHVEREISQ